MPWDAGWVQDMLEVMANSSALGIFHRYLGLCYFHVPFLRSFGQSSGGVYLETLLLVSKTKEILEM